jgi:hypothetical protein
MASSLLSSRRVCILVDGAVLGPIGERIGFMILLFLALFLALFLVLFLALFLALFLVHVHDDVVAPSGRWR